MPAPFAAAITPQRVLLYGLFSTGSALGVVFRAFRERSNFYSATIFLGRSNGCLLVLLNFLLCLALLFGRILQQVFFGALRPIEIEHLYERSWYSLVGTLLGISIFRDDFDISFVLLFGTLLFLKAFHWLSADRVEFMEQSPSVSRLFHVRMCSILSTLLFVDLFLVAFAVEILLIKRAKVGVMILFASEFMILTASLCSTIAKYGINCIDLSYQEPWEAKSMYIFYIDLVHDAVRLVTHTFFFALLTKWYGIPLSLIHDLYVTGRSCAIKIRDLVRYRKATKNMETKYPDATALELRNTDGTCIICREDMVARSQDPDSARTPTDQTDANTGSDAVNGAPTMANSSSSSGGLNMVPKKLPCGHIFHFHCLRSWLERQQSCPTCRRTVLDEGPQTTTPMPPPVQPVRAAAPQPGAVPPPPGTRPLPNQDPSASAAGAASGSPHISGASSSSGQATGQTAAETTFDQRLQGFLHKLQSDLRRVREQGDLSAQRAGSASRRASPGRYSGRSGYATPTQIPANSVGSNVHPGRHGPSSSSWPGHQNGFLPAPAPPGPWPTANYGGFGSQLGSYPDHVLAAAGGGVSGLWMPPPPSSLYLRGRRPERHSAPPHSAPPAEGAQAARDTRSRADPKGKARAVDLENASEAVAAMDTGSSPSPSQEAETASADPLDPREAIRLATLRRFGGVAGTGAPAVHESGSTQKATASNTTLGTDGPAESTSSSPPGSKMGLIPLFNTSAVPSALQGLSYPLISERGLPSGPSSALPTAAGQGQSDQEVLADKRAKVQSQILMLTDLHTRIDSLIDHLAGVLDAVAPDASDPSAPISTASAQPSESAPVDSNTTTAET
ncbi:hypothetical protein BCV70DRAFT_201584 [Testicularia cyperi]|uniref:RING-type E3 ubiquitin transferase n=1 Tax=Testicularia cyperi TaxID=1882483 RepID=A0A317XLW7_9BASI|nr:hypothetical protein BCV70DRAFT_201584 [Testicularia cyperi]